MKKNRLLHGYHLSLLLTLSAVITLSACTANNKTSDTASAKKVTAHKHKPKPPKVIRPIAPKELPSSEDEQNKTITSSPKFQGYCLNSELLNTSINSDQYCTSISQRLASVSFNGCMKSQLADTGCQSIKQFPLLMREFAPLPNKRPLGRVLLIGGTHGDELTSVSIVFKWMEKLNKFHSGLFHWHVLPMMNPDGVLRKDAQRTNNNGVDLNRNLPSKNWHAQALDYWHKKTDKNPRRYPGRISASEPESQWLVDEIKNFKPDVIVSVHAPYGMVDFDAPELNAAPKSLGKLRLNLLGTYPGSLGNYAGVDLGIPVITLELPHAWVMPSPKEIDHIWLDLVRWLKNNITPVNKNTSPLN